MQEFRGRVAVITGGASGIGKAMAERFAAAGMKIVLADVDEQSLKVAGSSLEALGAEVLVVRTDVSKTEDIESLARRTVEHFGAIHILCPNAGVSGTEGKIWETTAGEWEWIVGVNLLGVAHCIRIFVPIMLDQQSEGHIVTTASVLGLQTGPGLNIYSATKHAVVRMSEGLHFELRQVGSKLRVSVLCPSIVSTQIVDGERNWPAHLRDVPDAEQQRERLARKETWLAAFHGPGVMTAPEVAQQVFDAVREERFYILPHGIVKDKVRKRMEDIIEERTPEALPSAIQGP